MSEQEKFLARWSRRKREGGADEPAVKPDTPPDEKSAADASTPPARPAGEKPEPQIDLSELPSLDSITAETDIRGFLKPGVPADLSRAALRRAWATDPAIRDFIGLSENSWDFNNNEMHGFGPFDPSENLRKLLAQATGIPEPVEEGAPEDADSAGKAGVAQTADGDKAQEQQELDSNFATAAESEAAAESKKEMLHPHNRDTAPQQNEAEDRLPPRRKSGSALPT